MSKRFALVLALLLVVFGGIFFFTKNKANAPANGENAKTTAQATNHVKGTAAGGVTVVEYADFQCPACGQIYPIVHEIMNKYSDRVQFQFVNFPLYQIHQNAMAAHRAAEAASNQGKFWEMYDLLYTNQNAWSSSSTPTTVFEGYAQQLGLDAAKFKQDSGSSTTNDILWADINKGNAVKVNATPTFFVNGKELDSNPTSVEQFSKVLDEALKNKSS